MTEPNRRQDYAKVPSTIVPFGCRTYLNKVEFRERVQSMHWEGNNVGVVKLPHIGEIQSEYDGYKRNVCGQVDNCRIIDVSECVDLYGNAQMPTHGNHNSYPLSTLSTLSTVTTTSGNPNLNLDLNLNRHPIMIPSPHPSSTAITPMLPNPQEKIKKDCAKQVKKGFHCPVPGCFQTSSNKGNLSKHIATCHELRRDYVCPIAGCARKFAKKFNMHRHLSASGVHRQHKQCSPVTNCQVKRRRKRRLNNGIECDDDGQWSQRELELASFLALRCRNSFSARRQMTSLSLA